MSGSSDNANKGQLPAVPGYVDQVARKERLIEHHPDVVIEFDEEASPHARWRGQVPGHEQVKSGELGHLLDRLEEILAVDEAEQRWPGWTFSRIGNQWKGHEREGSRVVWGPTLRAAEARVGVEERST
jgi:hypothetical protein